MNEDRKNPEQKPCRHPIGDLMGVTMEKLKSMVDVNTIIGQPIVTPDGVTLIPVSRLSLGFASGGSEFDKEAVKPGNFGGGSGAGVKIEPVAFLVVRGDSVRLLPVGVPAATTADRVIEMVPEVVDKITDYLDQRKKDEDDDL